MKCDSSELASFPGSTPSHRGVEPGNEASSERHRTGSYYRVFIPSFSLSYDVVFRLGKSVDTFRGALRTIHLANPILRLLITLTKLNRGIYLLFDHIIWASRMKLAVIDIDYWHRLANRFWLVAIVLGLLRDVYELLVAIQAERNRLKQYGGSGGSSSAVVNVVRNNPPLMIDIVKNGADALIPASRLDLVYIPSGIIGLLGVVSSLAGLVATWDDRLRLKFS